MKARKAQSVSVRQDKERGANLARERVEMSNAPPKPCFAEKPTYPSRLARDEKKSDINRSSKSESGYKSRERSIASELKPFESTSRERNSPSRSFKKEWSLTKATCSPLKKGNSRTAQPVRKKTFGSKTRDSSQPRLSGASQNCLSKPACLGKARVRNSSASSKS